jgi:hypothetical protein
MTDAVIKTSNLPRYTTPRGLHGHKERCVRVFRSSPKDVMLQIRVNGRIIGVALMHDEARQVIEALQMAMEP